MENKAIPIALSVWLPNTPGLSRKSSVHCHSNTVLRPTTTYTQKKKRFNALTREFDSWVILGPIMAKWLIRIYSKPKCKWTHIKPQNHGENNSPNLNIEATGNTQPKLERRSDSQTGQGENIYLDPQVDKENAYTLEIMPLRPLFQLVTWGKQQRIPTYAWGQEITTISMWGWKRVEEEWCPIFPSHMKWKSLLVECVCGKGLVVLPHTTV